MPRRPAVAPRLQPRPGDRFRLLADGAGPDVARALHLDLTHRPPRDLAPLPGRAFVVENHAPFRALRKGPGAREPAWHAPDDRAPGRAMWALWCRRSALGPVERVRRRGRAAPVTAAYLPGAYRPEGPAASRRLYTGPGGAWIPSPGPRSGRDALDTAGR